MSSGVKNMSPIWYWARLKKFHTSLTESLMPSSTTAWITITLYRLIQKASLSSLVPSSSRSMFLRVLLSSTYSAYAADLRILS